jgi:hypothetical protein
MLSLAAREADIVHINYNLAEGQVNAKVVGTGRAEPTDEKMGWVKEAAGDRFEQIELASTMFFTSVTDDRHGVASAIAPRLQLEPEEIIGMPHFDGSALESRLSSSRVRWRKTWRRLSSDSPASSDCC